MTGGAIEARRLVCRRFGRRRRGIAPLLQPRDPGARAGVDASLIVETPRAFPDPRPLLVPDEPLPVGPEAAECGRVEGVDLPVERRQPGAGADRDLVRRPVGGAVEA